MIGAFSKLVTVDDGWTSWDGDRIMGGLPRLVTVDYWWAS